MPPECSGLIVDWLLEGVAPQPPRPVPVRQLPAVLRLEQGAIQEQTTLLDTPSGRLFAVTCGPSEPVASGEDWVVFLNTGRIRRGGTSRLSTIWARRRARASARSASTCAVSVTPTVSVSATSRSSMTRWPPTPPLCSTTSAGRRLARRAARREALHGRRSLLGSDDRLPAGARRAACRRSGADQHTGLVLGRPAEGAERLAAGELGGVAPQTGAHALGAHPRSRLVALGAQGCPVDADGLRRGDLGSLARTRLAGAAAPARHACRGDLQ